MGHALPRGALGNAELVELSENEGHIKGNSQLLKAGVERLTADFPYTVILESDTWLMDDRLIDRYINELEKSERRVWASANWVDKYHSLALDFALIKTSFLLKHPGLFDFTGANMAECAVYNYIKSAGFESVEIGELYPVHTPRILPGGPEVFLRRRNAFPSGPMVTHHLEHIGNSMEKKKEAANRAAGKIIFDTGQSAPAALALWRRLLIMHQAVLQIAPKSRWAMGRQIGE